MPPHPRLRPSVVACVALVLTAAAHLSGQPAGLVPGPTPGSPPPAAAAGPVEIRPSVAAPGEEELVGPVQMRGETLEAVLFQLGRLTGRSIIRPQALPATEGYTISLPPMPKSEVVLALETMLNLSGIAVNPLGDKFLKIVPLGQARTEAPEMIDGSTLGLPPSGRVATKLFRLAFLRVGELKDQIAPLLNPNLGGPVNFEKTNAVLITDSISTLQRIETLITELDKPATASLQPKFYPLRFAKASDLVTRIGGILKPPLSSQISSATSISADDRTNQIVLISDPRQYPFFDELIAKLDVKSDPNTRNEVLFLKHATAKDVATLLTNLVSGQNQAASRGEQQGAARPGQTGYNSATAPANPPPAVPPKPAAANPLQTVVENVAAESGGTSQFSSLVTVLADDRSNSIVVSGTVDDLRLIKDIVEKVDVLLAQVSIQVVIVEVTLSDTDTSGINALNLTVGQNPRGATGITKFELPGSAGANGIAGWNITGGVVTPLAFQAALGNTGAKSNVKVLSANTIVTTHNKQAEFVVSQQQPIITGSQSSIVTAGSTPVTTSTVTYKDIGIDVKVTPLIGDDGSIQLEIDQKVDDVVGNVQVDANTQPIIGHREATSFINVGDGQMIVLGGLQQTKHSTDRNKLGFLYQIPIISQLLGGRSHTESRTELLLFVRPHIIRAGETTQDANLSIDQLTNRDQVKQYLQDPAKDHQETLIKQLTQ
jgi:general secretion pathway protein D